MQVIWNKATRVLRLVHITKKSIYGGGIHFTFPYLGTFKNTYKLERERRGEREALCFVDVWRVLNLSFYRMYGAVDGHFPAYEV